MAQGDKEQVRFPACRQAGRRPDDDKTPAFGGCFVLCTGWENPNGPTIVLRRNKAILVLRLAPRIHTSVFAHCQSNYIDMNDVTPMDPTVAPAEPVMEPATPEVPEEEVVAAPEAVPATDAPAA